MSKILYFLGMAGVPLRLAIGSTPRCVGIDEAWQGMQNAKESPQNTRVWTANSELSFQSSMLHNNTSNVLRSEQLDQTLTMVVDSSEWTNAISKQGERAIRVAILGCSVSAGCGAEDSNPAECSFKHSWGSQLASWLDGFPGVRFNVQIWARRAVKPEYFKACTDRFVSRADVVLLEFQPTLQADSMQRISEALEEIVAAVRRAAPRAPIVVVGWRSVSSSARGRAGSCETALTMSAIHLGVDLVLSGLLLPLVGNLSLHARDRIHPNTLGSEVLAQAVARLVARHTVDAMCSSTRMHLGTLQPRLPQTTSTRVDEKEWCTEDARSLPAVHTNGWSLVNEGGSGQASKYGYLSTTAEADDSLKPLTLNVSAMLPGVTCAVLRGSLLYEQSWRPSAGDFYVRCSGSCLCTQLPGEPFPHVTAHLPSLGATITSATRFIIRYGVGDFSNCFLHVKHIKRRKSSQRNTTRVRIDGLNLEVLDCRSLCFALMRPKHVSRVSSMIGEFGRGCAVGYREGKPGHLGPSCLQNTSNATDARSVCVKTLRF